MASGRVFSHVLSRSPPVVEGRDTGADQEQPSQRPPGRSEAVDVLEGGSQSRADCLGDQPASHPARLGGGRRHWALGMARGGPQISGQLRRRSGQASSNAANRSTASRPMPGFLPNVLNGHGGRGFDELFGKPINTHGPRSACHRLMTSASTGSLPAPCWPPILPWARGVGRRLRRRGPRGAVRCGHVHGPHQGPDSSPTALRIAGRMTRMLPSTTGAPQTPISITRAPSPARRAYEVARMPNPVAPSRNAST